MTLYRFIEEGEPDLPTLVRCSQCEHIPSNTLSREKREERRERERERRERERERREKREKRREKREERREKREERREKREERREKREERGEKRVGVRNGVDRRYKIEYARWGGTR